MNTNNNCLFYWVYNVLNILPWQIYTNIYGHVYVCYIGISILRIVLVVQAIYSPYILLFGLISNTAKWHVTGLFYKYNMVKI